MQKYFTYLPSESLLIAGSGTIFAERERERERERDAQAYI
jgi:hypothetical protein